MIKVWCKVIAVLEIVGGLTGLAFTCWILLTSIRDLFKLALGLVVIGIYCFSCVAGFALWQGRAFGKTASIIIQSIQLPKIVSSSVIFMFSFGFDCWVQFLQTSEAATVGFQFRFLGFNQLFLNVQNAPFGFGVSLLSVVFLAVLFRFKPIGAPDPISPPSPPVWS